MSNVKKYKTFLLSKKKWHVGLPENIAKVKKDEEEYRIKQEEDKRQNILNASEQRIEILRKRNDDEENSDLPVIVESNSKEKTSSNSSNSSKSSTIQQETFKNLQNVPWYCKIEGDDGKKIVAREMRVSYHGSLLESKQQIIPIGENLKSTFSNTNTMHSSTNVKTSSSYSAGIIDGSEYLSSLSQSLKPNTLNHDENLLMNTSMKGNKNMDEENEVLPKKEKKGKELKISKNLSERGMEIMSTKKKEEESLEDQNVSLPPDFHTHHKKRKKDESDDSNSDCSSTSSSSSSSGDSVNRKKKRKREKTEERKKKKKEKEKEKRKRKRKKI